MADSSLLTKDYLKQNQNVKQSKVSQTELNKYLKKEYSGGTTNIPKYENANEIYLYGEIKSTVDTETLAKYGLARGSSNPWDQLKINEVQVPGLIKIKVSFENDVKQEKRPGYDYTKIKLQGANSKLVSISIKMNGYDYQYFREWILPLLYVEGYISHRDIILTLENISLEDYQISKAVLLSYEQEAPEVGIVEVTLSLIEYHEEVRRSPVDIKNVKLPALDEGVAADALDSGYGSKR